jgi:hypothetical protein
MYRTADAEAWLRQAGRDSWGVKDHYTTLLRVVNG